MFTSIISLCICCLHKDLVPGDTIKLWKFLQDIHSFSPHVLTTYYVLHAAASTEDMGWIEQSGSGVYNLFWGHRQQSNERITRVMRWGGVGKGGCFRLPGLEKLLSKAILSSYLNGNKDAARQTPLARIFQAQQPVHAEPKAEIKPSMSQEQKGSECWWVRECPQGEWEKVRSGIGDHSKGLEVTGRLE